MALDSIITQTATITTSNVNFDPVQMSTSDSCSLQIVRSGASSSDAVLNLAVSNDGVNYDDLSGSSIDISANGSDSFYVGPVNALYIRAEVVATTGTVAAVLTWVCRKLVT